VTPAAEDRRTVTAAAAPSVGAVASAHLDLPTKTVTSHTTAKAPTSTVAELPLASAKKQIEVVVDEEDPAPVNQVGAKAIELPEAIEPAVTAKITTTLSASDPSCKSGELEAKRARSATSDADKLFYLRRAIRLCPSSVAYHLEIGEIYKSIGRDEDAAYEARQVLDLEPTNSAAKKLLSAVESAGVDQAATAAKVE